LSDPVRAVVERNYLPDLGQHELMSPDFPLASEAVGTDELEPKRAKMNGWLQSGLTR